MWGTDFLGVRAAGRGERWARTGTHAGFVITDPP